MLGEIIEFQSGWDRYRPSLNLDAWREQGQAGSGILYDLGVHLFDQTLCLFGEPSSVTADIRIQRENGLSDDYFEIVLGYERLKVIVKSTKLVREPGPRYRVHGTKGSYVKYGDEPQEALLIAGRLPTEAGWGAEPQELWGKINTDWNGLHLQGQVETLRGSYCSYYQDIYEAITMNRPPAVLPEQARQTIRLVELARQSYEERRTVDYS
jgi:predicted dehydrogenase